MDEGGKMDCVVARRGPNRQNGGGATEGRTPRGRTGRGRLGVIAAALAVLAAACGDDAESRTGASAPAHDFNETYQLMVIGPFTASSTLPTPFPELAAGAQAGAAAVNDAGGVNGRAIEIVECDTRADPNAATGCARQAVRDGIPAVVGAFDLRGDYLSVLEEAGVPVLAPFARDAELTSEVAYPVNGGSYSLSAGEVSLLASEGAESVSFVLPDAGNSGQDMAERVAPVEEANPGLDVSLIPVPGDATDLSAVAASADERDAVAIALQGAQLVPFLTTFRQLAGDDKPITSDSNSLTPELIDQLGATAEGVYAPSVFLPPTTEGDSAVDEFNENMERVDADAPRNDFSTNAYVGVRLFAEAAEGLDRVDGPSLVEALDGVTDLDLGLFPPISFDEPSHAYPGLTRLFNANVVYVHVVDGEFVPVDGEFVDAQTGEPAT